MKVQVDQEVRVEQRATRQECAGEFERDAVEVDTKRPAQRDVAFAHQSQGREEVLGELAVGHPGPLARGLEREGVDEHRSTASELHVVGAANP